MDKLFKTGVFLFATLYATYGFCSNFSQRKEVQDFIEAVANKHHLEKKQLTHWFNQYESSKDIIQRISKPAEKLSWQQYKKIFLTQKRINAGVQFWKKHQASLNRAEKKFGVPPEIVVSILGVETFYGKQTGRYPVLQALSTLAFDYPPRAKFFKQELENFLVLTHENKLNPLALKGSYAGAMGTPQFIPSSYRSFAIDFANKGSVDLNNTVNAIGSTANYLYAHGYKSNQAIVHQATVNGEKHEKIKRATSKNSKPTLSLSNLASHGITPNNTTKSKLTNKKLSLIELEGKDKSKEYWLGENNFYVITRYNHSINYAMVVYQLAQSLKNSF